MALRHRISTVLPFSDNIRLFFYVKVDLIVIYCNFIYNSFFLKFLKCAFWIRGRYILKEYKLVNIPLI